MPTLCPIALAVGCEKCPAFGFCPAKGFLGDYKKVPADPEKAEETTSPEGTKSPKK